MGGAGVYLCHACADELMKNDFKMKKRSEKPAPLSGAGFSVAFAENGRSRFCGERCGQISFKARVYRNFTIKTAAFSRKRVAFLFGCGIIRKV